MSRKREDPGQQAWAEYIKLRLPQRDAIMEAHRAFLAGYKVGFSEGANTIMEGDHAKEA